MGHQPENRVIVFGGGLAGLSAAVAAAEAGAAVTLFEKAPELGGTTALSGGYIWTFADYNRLRADVPEGDPALQWLVYDGVDAGRTWLESLGVRLGPETPLLGHGRGRQMEPVQAIAVMAERLRALGGSVVFETGIDSLIVKGGIVCGARVAREGRIHEEMARSVVLATGGFQGNHELLARYVVRDPDNLYLRANPWSTGDGFLAATKVGAAVSPGLDTFYGHALAGPPARFSRLELGAVSQYYGRQSVAINLLGERFADETAGNGEESLVQPLAQQPTGGGFYVIDQNILRSRPVEDFDLVTRTLVERAMAIGTPVVMADSLEDLCRGLATHDVPAVRALEELRQFNALIEAGRADEMRPARKRFRTPLVRGPFLAIRVKAAITFTMGGLAIDERARVLRRSGGTSLSVPMPISRAFKEDDDAPVISIGSEYRQMPIQGLYAAGCDAGNISHFNYVGGLATALTTGRTAGREAAAFSRRGASFSSV